MEDGRDEGRGKRPGGKAGVTDLAMGHYVKRLSEGCNYRQAAEGSGYHHRTFGKQRKRNPEFAAACQEAVERSTGMRFIEGGKKRTLQLRRNRCTRFLPERQEIFLSWFAATGNLTEAADKAGVSSATIDSHRRKHPEFEQRLQEALSHAYLKLDSELLAGRLAAQRRSLEIKPADEPGPEFDRALKLLQRWDRNKGSNKGASRGVAQERWDFADSITLLEKKLRNMGIPILPLPPGFERPDGDLPLLPPPADNRGEGGEGRNAGEGIDEGEDWDEGEGGA